MKTTTQITLETERVLMIRRRTFARRWCSECGSEVDVLNLVRAKALTDMGQHELRDGAQAKGWHCFEVRTERCWFVWSRC
jgi:hypothetical protein